MTRQQCTLHSMNFTLKAHKADFSGLIQTLFVLTVQFVLWGVLILSGLRRLRRETHGPPLSGCELTLSYTKQPNNVNMFRLDLKIHCLHTGKGIDFFLLWLVIYCQYDCCSVITHPDSFKRATINMFIMATPAQWQRSVLVINLHRIISWICRFPRLKRGFMGSLGSLFSCPPSPVVLARSRCSLQRDSLKVSDKQ